ncbi:hypothetical protein D3C81_1394330 [compost metagenome]
MPMPVSATVKTSTDSLVGDSSTLACNATLPCSVNLIALPSRLSRIWRRRMPSACTWVGTSACTDCRICRPLACARGASRFSALSHSSRTSSAAGTNFNRPASSLEWSSTSSRICRSAWPAVEASCTWRCWPGASGECSSSSNRPRMPCSGVRISWLIIVRKLLLARAEASAASRARARSRTRARSCSAAACSPSISTFRSCSSTTLCSNTLRNCSRATQIDPISSGFGRVGNGT